MDADALVLKQYLDAGAVPIVVANMPFGGLGPHTENPIFGEALNPYNFHRSCGGGGGGEAGLLGAKCAPFALGTSLNGDISLPAAFCHVYAFKPTTGRFTTSGIGSARVERME